MANYIIRNARLLFRNFSGAPNKFGNTDRTFCVILPPDKERAFREEGFNVKTLKPRDEEEEPTPFVQVKVRYGYRPPKVTLIAAGARTPLTEDTISQLDFADIEQADLSIRPYHGRTRAGIEFCTAYLDKAYITIATDELDAIYNPPAPEEEEPPEEWR